MPAAEGRMHLYVFERGIPAFGSTAAAYRRGVGHRLLLPSRPVGHRQRDRAGAGSLEPVYTGALLSLSGILSAHSRHGAARGGLWAQVTPPITGAAPGRRRFQAPRAWCANHGGHARREPKAAPERLRRRSYPGRPAALASPLAGLRFLVRRKRIRLRGLVRAVVCAARLVLRPRLAAKYPHDSHCPALVQARREMLES